MMFRLSPYNSSCHGRRNECCFSWKDDFYVIFAGGGTKIVNCFYTLMASIAISRYHTHRFHMKLNENFFLEYAYGIK